MKLQKYQDGEIHRIGNVYQFVKNSKVKSTHDSVQELVDHVNRPKKTRKNKTQKSESNQEQVVETTE